MRRFSVKVRTETEFHSFIAVGSSSADVHKAAEDRFGGLSCIVVIPL
ncbi:hypothetical protein SAMN06265795_12221 [Noviherbaspirillum humi]|uniref:Uncharacterized protein n=1 Tax=Noviherbaspirillum humi TaxID=1688639 RepID=A0A239LDE6_9BURK|nr:hypothetical protein [Noviherbaspirillum humi]SNT28666.1 hypothetical protein SAMN06265795_12221 [Noviherbaspirillum humi]